MDNADKTLDKILDTMGVPEIKAPVVSNITYDPEKRGLSAPESADGVDYKKLNKRKAIFKQGSLLITKTKCNAFISNDHKEEVADMYMRSGVSIISKGSILMILKEGIIRSEYNLSSIAELGMLTNRGPEACYRFIKALSTHSSGQESQRRHCDGEPSYVTLLINPDFDAEQLKNFFDFSDESVIKSATECKELDLTSELSVRVEARKEKIIAELQKKAK